MRFCYLTFLSREAVMGCVQAVCTLPFKGGGVALITDRSHAHVVDWNVAHTLQCTLLNKFTLSSLVWTQKESNGRQVTPVNSNTTIIRTSFMSLWVFEFSRFYCRSTFSINLECFRRCAFHYILLRYTLKTICSQLFSTCYTCMHVWFFAILPVV